jgi:hypothetical protein
MRPTCVHCGKAYGQRATHSHQLKDGEDYDGYLQVVRRHALRTQVGTGRTVQEIELWNGKSWIGGYEPFCTLRCALAYARRAYNKTKGAL